MVSSWEYSRRQPSRVGMQSVPRPPRPPQYVPPPQRAHASRQPVPASRQPVPASRQPVPASRQPVRVPPPSRVKAPRAPPPPPKPVPEPYQEEEVVEPLWDEQEQPVDGPCEFYGEEEQDAMEEEVLEDLPEAAPDEMPDIKEEIAEEDEEEWDGERPLNEDDLLVEEPLEEQAEEGELKADPGSDKVMDGNAKEDIDEEPETPEHLKDVVEGSNRLKRLLEKSAATPTNGSFKRRKVTSAGQEAKIKQLLQKWRVTDDVACRYILETLRPAELDAMISESWTPERKHMRTAAEQINEHAIQQRERMTPSSGPLDTVDTFKFRWKVGTEETGLLKNATHKEIRYALAEFDGTRPLKEVIEASKTEIAPEEDTTAHAAPEAPGAYTLGRIYRLELIDPNADALIIGDANLSFSLLLAEHRKSLAHTGNLIATTFETLDTLKERYEDIEDTVARLHSYGAKVWHGVDCTRLGVDTRFRGLEDSFGAVYYNFPHAGAVRGFFDDHPFVRWRHENLMHLFFRCLTVFVKPGGSVKVSSNSSATGVRYSDIIWAAKLSEFEHVQTVSFKEWKLRKYSRAFGDRRDAKRKAENNVYTSQRAEQDMVYSFGYAPTGRTLAKVQVKRPPSCSDLLAGTCACACGFICHRQMQFSEHAKYHFKASGPHAKLDGQAKQKSITELYQRFLSEISGHHVG